MTLRHLRIFVAVYQERSITRAADRLHLAQPSVSLAIRELEENYKIRLFERFSRRLFITEQGEQLYDYALHIISLFDEMEEKFLPGSSPLLCGSAPALRSVIFSCPRSFSNIPGSCLALIPRSP